MGNIFVVAACTAGNLVGKVALFVGKMFVVRPRTTKATNILPHENYLLYGIIIIVSWNSPLLRKDLSTLVLRSFHNGMCQTLINSWPYAPRVFVNCTKRQAQASLSLKNVLQSIMCFACGAITLCPCLACLCFVAASTYTKCLPCVMHALMIIQMR